MLAPSNYPLGKTANDLRRIVGAGEVWSRQHDGECPTISTLIGEGRYPAETGAVDEWGTPYALSCPGPGQIVASSADADRMWNTADDKVMTVEGARSLNAKYPF